MHSTGEQELGVLRELAQRGDLRAALQVLNQRTAFRYTALYSCEGQTLRCVCVYDRWDPATVRQPDAPLSTTYCAIVEQSNLGLDVSDGRSDQRFPWLMNSSVVSYCGAPVRNTAGQVIGTVCHFDHQPCQAARRELPLLDAAASIFAPFIAAHPQRDDPGAPAPSTAL